MKVNSQSIINSTKQPFSTKTPWDTKRKEKKLIHMKVGCHNETPTKYLLHIGPSAAIFLKNSAHCFGGGRLVGHDDLSSVELQVAAIPINEDYQKHYIFNTQPQGQQRSRSF